MVIYSEPKATCFKGLFLVPAITMSISAIWLLIIVFRLFRSSRWKRGDSSGKGSRNPNQLFLIVPITCLLALQICAYSLLKHGAFLPFEEEKDLLLESGRIQSVSHEVFSPRFSLGAAQNVSHGCVLLINGASYYCLADNHLTVGDTVTIQYLPKSKIILVCIKESEG